MLWCHASNLNLTIAISKLKSNISRQTLQMNMWLWIVVVCVCFFSKKCSFLIVIRHRVGGLGEAHCFQLVSCQIERMRRVQCVCQLQRYGQIWAYVCGSFNAFSSLVPISIIKVVKLVSQKTRHVQKTTNSTHITPAV